MKLYQFIYLGMALCLGTLARAQTTTVSNKTYPSGTTATVVGPTTVTTSGNVTAASGSNVLFIANTSVYLGPGFSAQPGSIFNATISSNLPAPPPPPSFSPAPGPYASPQSITITDSMTSGVTIYYTTNGSTPTVSSANYTGAISLPVGTTKLSAIAVNSFGTSTVTSGRYTVVPLVNKQWGPNNFADFVANKPIVVDPATGYVVAATLGPVAQAFPFNDGNSTVYLANGPVTLSSPNNPSIFQIIDNTLQGDNLVAAPTGLKVAKNPDDKADPPTTQLLSWTAPANDNNVAGYEILMDGTSFSTVDALSLLSIIVPNANHTFSVQSYDADGNLSSPVTLVVNMYTYNGSPSAPPPSPAPNLIITGSSGTTVSLLWSAPTDITDVDGYNIYAEPSGDIDPNVPIAFTFGGSGNTGTTLVGTTSSTVTSFTVTGLTAKTTYFFSVEGFDVFGNLSASSNTIEFTTNAPQFPAYYDPTFKAPSSGGDSGTFGFPTVTSGTLAYPQTFPFDDGTDTITFAAAPITISGLYITSGTLASAQDFPFDGGTRRIYLAAAPVTISGTNITSGTLSKPQSFPFDGGTGSITLASAPVTISGTDFTSGTLASTQSLPFGNGSTTSDGQSTIPFAAGPVTIKGTYITSGTLASQESFSFSNASNGAITLAPGHVIFSGSAVSAGILASSQKFQLYNGLGTFTLAAAPVTFNGVYITSGLLDSMENLPFGNGLSTSDGKYTIPFAAARVTFNIKNGTLASGTLASQQSFNIATPANDYTGIAVTVMLAAAPVTFNGASFSGTLPSAQSLTINGGASEIVPAGTVVQFVNGYYVP
jgi:hypothetical protein